MHPPLFVRIRGPLRQLLRGPLPHIVHAHRRDQRLIVRFAAIVKRRVDIGGQRRGDDGVVTLVRVESWSAM